MRTYRPRRIYDQAFKQEAVRLVLEEGRKAFINRLLDTLFTDIVGSLTTNPVIGLKEYQICCAAG